jgi:hypothetical protein
MPKNLSELNEDENHRTVTDINITNWNNKSDFDGLYSSLNGKPDLKPCATTGISEGI